MGWSWSWGWPRYGAGLDGAAAQRAADAFTNSVKDLLATLPERCLEPNPEVEAQLGKLLIYADTFGFQAVEARQALDKCRVRITILPPLAVTLEPGEEHQFIASITGVFDVNSADHTWKASGGTIDQAGNFSANEPGTYTVTVTSDINPLRTASATATVRCPGQRRADDQCEVTNGPIVYIEASPAPVRGYAVQPDGSGRTPITGTISQFANDPRVSPDGARVHFPLDRLLVGVDGANPRTLPDLSTSTAWVDSRTLAGSVSPGSKLALYDVDGAGGPVPLPGDATGTVDDVSPDDTRLLVEGGGLATIGIDGGNRVPIDAGGRFARFSPDGTKVVFLRYAANEVPADVVVANADGSNPVVVEPRTDETIPMQPEWSPDSTRVLVSVPVSISDDPEDPESGYRLASVKADGTERTFLTPAPVRGGFKFLEGADFSPDGTQVVVGQPTETKIVIAVVPADGSAAPTPIASTATRSIRPVWARGG